MSTGNTNVSRVKVIDIKLGRTLCGDYWIGKVNSKWDKRWGFKSYIFTFCDSEFHELTCIRLERGELKDAVLRSTRKGLSLKVV